MHPQYNASPYPPAPPPVIVIEKPNATISNIGVMGDVAFCEYCQQKTANVKRTNVGGVTLAWCFFLLLLTGGLLSLVPFCCDDCKDTEIVCQNCTNTKTKIDATCC